MWQRLCEDLIGRDTHDTLRRAHNAYEGDLVFGRREHHQTLGPNSPRGELALTPG